MSIFQNILSGGGAAREEFLRATVPSAFELLSHGIKFVTHSASLEFKHETALFDEILIKITVSNIKPASFDLDYTYSKNETLIASGKQKITFEGPAGKVTKIPPVILDVIKQYEQ